MAALTVAAQALDRDFKRSISRYSPAHAQRYSDYRATIIQEHPDPVVHGATFSAIRSFADFAISTGAKLDQVQDIDLLLRDFDKFQNSKVKKPSGNKVSTKAHDRYHYVIKDLMRTVMMLDIPDGRSAQASVGIVGHEEPSRGKDPNSWNGPKKLAATKA